MTERGGGILTFGCIVKTSKYEREKGVSAKKIERDRKYRGCTK